MTNRLDAYPVPHQNNQLKGAADTDCCSQKNGSATSEGCTDDASHKMHMCYLKSQGLDLCIKSISDNPTVECRHCGAKANSVENVCAAHLEGDAPNVEGGHGSVGLDQIG